MRGVRREEKDSELLLMAIKAFFTNVTKGSFIAISQQFAVNSLLKTEVREVKGSH